ncbi:hypothetical protein RHCRD62_50200 [Rhodococcus sp. RD6.2]|nr:hypothetical protein RHCRD62_50200 [Rhodococcus sp. RD6.2]
MLGTATEAAVECGPSALHTTAAECVITRQRDAIGSFLVEAPLRLLGSFLESGRRAVAGGVGIAVHVGIVAFVDIVIVVEIVGVFGDEFTDDHAGPGGHHARRDLEVDRGLTEGRNRAVQTRGRHDAVTDAERILQFRGLRHLLLLTADTEEHRHQQGENQEREQQFHR